MEMPTTMPPMRRRLLFRAAALGALALGIVAAAQPAQAQRAKTTLVIGIDISDTITHDTARMAQYTTPAQLHNVYDTLLTMDPGDYVTLKAQLATNWARTPDGKGWRFSLRKDVKFVSGNPLNAEDVKWSFDRVLNLKD